jgi:hypothetical protein
MGFEPTRAEPIGLAVQRHNHSATSSLREIFEQLDMFDKAKYSCGFLTNGAAFLKQK